MRKIVETEKLKKLITPYLNLDGVDFVAVVDFKGALFYSEATGDCIKSENHLNELIKSLIETITDKYNAGSLYTDSQRIVFVKAGTHAIVITCIQSYVSLDAVFPYAYVIAEKVARTFDNRPILPMMPDFGKIITTTQAKKPTGPKGFVLFSKSTPVPETFSYKMVIGGEFAVGTDSSLELFLIGNKIDLKEDRKVSTEQGRELAKSLGIPYLETSALNSDIVEEAFQLIAFKLIQDKIQISEN